MPDAFPSMPLTDAQAAVKAGEAVLAYGRWCRTTYTPESVCRTREVRGLSQSLGLRGGAIAPVTDELGVGAE